MGLLIDGYNVIHECGLLTRGVGPGSLEKARNALLNTLAESLSSQQRERTSIVFDAPQRTFDLESEQNVRGMKIFYATHLPDADSLIEQLIKEHSAPKQLSVISSDHRIQKAAKRRKCKYFDSEPWWDQLLQSRQSKTAPTKSQHSKQSLKPKKQLSETEVEFWMQEFEADDLKIELDRIELNNSRSGEQESKIIDSINTEEKTSKPKRSKSKKSRSSEKKPKSSQSPEKHPTEIDFSNQENMKPYDSPFPDDYFDDLEEEW